MIATTNINLKVPFNEKDQAKSLGAPWNAEAKLLYVPQGVEAAPFEGDAFDVEIVDYH